MATTTTKRTIYYYEFKFKYYKDHEDTMPYTEIFKHIIALNKKLDIARITKDKYGYLLTNEVSFEPADKFIKGKLLRVRPDAFPSIINMTNDEIRTLASTSVEGVVETTHFRFDFSKPNLAHLAIEYNHFGPRTSDFANYIKKIGHDIKIIRNIQVKIIVQNRMQELVNRMARCADFSVKVHQENIQQILTDNKELGTALYECNKFSQSQYVNLKLSFDYSSVAKTSKIDNVINSFIGIFSANSQKLNLFDKFQVRAEDTENENKLELFDLLTDKHKSEIDVKTKSKTIDSNDILRKIKEEYIKLFRDE